MTGREINRRQFLTGAMAFAAGLGLERISGDIFSATPAYAAKSTNEIKIMIVRPSEIGIVAYDMTDPQNPVPVPNCKVTIKSRFNKKSVSDVSNSDGKIVLDIADLAEDDPDHENENPSFNGSITVEKEGYRVVNIPLTRISGHSAFIAPTRPLDNKPYFRSLTMNEWDVQYTKPQFITGSSNTETQKIAGEIWMPDASSTPKASLVVQENGEERTIEGFKVLSKDGNICKVEVANELLNSDKDCCIGGSLTPKVVFGDAKSSKEFETTISLATKPAATKEEQTESKVIIPGAVDHTYKLFSFPESFVSPLKGMQCTLWQPTCPFICQITPAGYLILGYGYSNLRGKDDTGHILPQGSWKTYPNESFAKQLKTEYDREMKLIDSYKQQNAVPNDPTRSKNFSHKLFSNFTVGVKLQVYGMMKYDYFDGIWKGALSGVFAASASATWTLQMALMCIPVFIQVSPSVTFNVSLYLGIKTKSFADLLSLEGTPERTLGLGITVGLSVGVGVGIAGFVSISCTGAGYVSFFINYLPNPDVENPRLIAGYGIQVYVTIQVMFFKYSFTVWELDEPQAYDSAKKTKLSSSSQKDAQAFLAQDMREKLGLCANNTNVTIGSEQMPSFAELAKNAVIVTNAEMLNSREFKMYSDFQGENSVTVTFEDSQVASNESTVFNADDAFDDVVVAENAELRSGTNESDHLPKYEYVGQMETAGLLANNSVGIEGISDNPLGGIKPTFDNLLFKDVTSNPKLKVVGTRTDWDEPQVSHTYVFRLTNALLYDKYVRSRLVYHVLKNGEWSKPHIVDFDTNYARVDRYQMYDVDFDACFVRSKGRFNGRNYIFVNVIHSTRPNGDDTSFYDGVQAKLASLVALYETGDENEPLKVDPTMTTHICHAQDDGTLLTPAITAYAGENESSEDLDACVMATLLYSKIDSEGGLTSTPRICGWFGRQEIDTDGQVKFRVSRSREGQAIGTQAVLFPGANDDWNYDEPKKNGCSKNRRAICAVAGGGKVDIISYNARYSRNEAIYNCYEGFSSTKLATSSSKYTVDKIHKFGKSRKYRNLIATCKGKTPDGADTSIIYRLYYNEGDEGDIEFAQIGESRGSVTDFTADPNQNYIFFAENIDGKRGQEFEVDEETGEAKAADEVVEHKYYIKAMACYAGLFTRPFVFAEIDHAADFLVASNVEEEECISFLVDDITDMSKSVSNIYDVRVPIVKCITPTTLTCKDPFCFSGQNTTFSVSIRNDGNVIATACTFYLVDAETDERVAKKRVYFWILRADLSSEGEDESSEKSVYSTDGWDAFPELASSPLAASSGYNVLLPGETETYDVDFLIPESWKKEKTVRVEIDEINYLTPSATLASTQSAELSEDSDSPFTDEQSGDDIPTYSVPDSELPTETITLASELTVDAEGESGEVRERGAENAQTTENATSLKATEIPKTGDDSRGSLALAALGAGAAGFVAYSNRRTEIENEKREAVE